jgi:hypothetical protein
MARPRPVVPPATTATLPVKSNKLCRIEEILYRIALTEESMKLRSIFAARSGQKSGKFRKFIRDSNYSINATWCDG